MQNIIAIPYKTFRQKIQIQKKNKRMGFNDLDNVLYCQEYYTDEPSARQILLNRNRQI